jgi:general secretion pathway protein F
VARVRQGGALSEGLADARLGYPGFVLALVRAGEASGELEAVLREAASQMEVQQKAAQDVKTSLVYPAILVLAGIGAILVIFLGVVPRFATLVASSRGSVPELSRWVIQAGVFLRAHIDTLAYAAAVLALVGAYLMSLQAVRSRLLEMLLHLPLVGPWLKQVELGRWALVLGALLQNRVPLMQAIDLSGGTFRFRAFREAVPGLASSVRMGHSLAASLERLEWLDASRVNMVRTGERAGQLAGMLTILGRTQVEAAARSQRRLILLIEPAAILLIGGIIGIVMYAVMMAVVGLNSSVG